MFGKVKRKNSLKISGFHEMFHAIYLIIKECSFISHDATYREFDYTKLEIEYSNSYGYFQTIKIGDLFDLEKVVSLLKIEKFPELFFDEPSPFIPANIFKCLLGKKAQSFNFLVIDSSNTNISKQLTSFGIIHHNCGFYTPQFSVGNHHYYLYVLKSEEDANLAMLTCFKKVHKTIDLKEIRKEFMDCIKVPKL